MNLIHRIADPNLSGRQKKKYVCKLLYMYILGWDVDFGHMEAVNLLSSNKYSEKQIVGSYECSLVYSFLITAASLGISGCDSDVNGDQRASKIGGELHEEGFR